MRLAQVLFRYPEFTILMTDKMTATKKVVPKNLKQPYTIYSLFYFFANCVLITFNAPPALNQSICGALYV